MGPSKPRLEPLQTRKAKTFPSELLDSSLTAGSHTTEHEDDNTASITPPPSYTEFLKVFTPVFGSPTNDDVSSPRFTFENPGPSPVSVPSSTTSQSFSSTRNTSRNKFQSAVVQPPSSAPHTATDPGSLQRLRIPSSAICSPGIASPQSAHSIRSPYSASEWSRRFVESPRFGDGQSSTLQHVRTTATTVSLKRTPRLARPPERKRRRSNEEHGPDS